MASLPYCSLVLVPKMLGVLCYKESDERASSGKHTAFVCDLTGCGWFCTFNVSGQLQGIIASCSV